MTSRVEEPHRRESTGGRNGPYLLRSGPRRSSTNVSGVPLPGSAAAARAGSPALGLVAGTGISGVGALLLHERTLVVHAFEALVGVPGVAAAIVGGGEDGRPRLAPGQPWRPLATGGLVLHDPACPLLPTDAITRCLRELTSAPPATAVIGVRPVTDTIKEVVDGTIAGTVDRAALATLAAPLVVGPDLLDPLSAHFPLAGDLGDLTDVVQVLTTLGSVVPMEVPWSARRVNDESDVELLECLHELRQTLRER